MTDNPLKNKIVLITGATSGFGLACARTLAAEGAKVIITGRRTERLQSLAQEREGAFYPLCFDVRDESAVKAAIASLPSAWGKIDILVNNAGLALGTEPFDTKPHAETRQMLDTNINGLLTVTEAVLPGMVARGQGHIINISSVAGSYPYPGGNAYGATKAFVTQFSLNLRADLVAKNIRVTSIEPGLAETEFSLVRFHGDEQKAKAVYDGTKPLTSEDIAEAVRWVASLPAHVNINRIEVMPTCQAFGGFALHRQP
ncbi:MAG: SDR family oxidoreductase [Rickettsiales bacterium]|nr:SDR family oxidoreductase [Rickettsiales bacterium]